METILNYNDFKEQLIKDVECKLPHYEINITQVYKNNGMKDAIIGRYDNKDIVPTVYINEFYNDYIDNSNSNSYENSLQEVIKLITSCEDNENKITLEGNKCKGVVSKLNDLEHNVLPRFVCTKTNTDMLKNLVHREFLDMSIYYVVQTEINGGVSSIKITNDMLKSLKQDVTEEQLYKWSIENIKKNNNFAIGISKLMYCIMFGLDASNHRGYEKDDVMIVIQNDCGIYGANNILNNDILKEVADNINSDLYILPSSVHEIIVVPTILGLVQNELREMVKQVNTEKVGDEDRLTDTIYLYSRNTDKVTIVE